GGRQWRGVTTTRASSPPSLMPITRRAAYTSSHLLPRPGSVQPGVVCGACCSWRVSTTTKVRPEEMKESIMTRNAEGPGGAIPDPSQTIGTGFVDMAAATAFDAPRGKRSIDHARV